MAQFQKFIVLALLLLSNLDSKPISEKDRRITILYVCHLEGELQFDEDGRRGLATISEVKRREAEKIFRERGGVLLLSRGNFFESTEHDKSFKLMKDSLFDSILLEEEEINYFEKNPNLKKLNLPILSPRENILGLDTEKIFDLDGIHVRVNSYLLNKIPIQKTKQIHVNLIFPEKDESIDFSKIHPEIPVIFFLPREKTSDYSFHANVYTAHCPEKKGMLGKIHLYFRDNKLIRESQEMILLNTKEQNQNWIRPHEEVLKSLDN
ncbi:MAG: hypothetical protein SFU98_01360 [Leptospiraceae bacterium]|nr:hypothetical protein [Leptospiraceae bacterium]